jgi:hypothetical protein
MVLIMIYEQGSHAHAPLGPKLAVADGFTKCFKFTLGDQGFKSTGDSSGKRCEIIFRSIVRFCKCLTSRLGRNVLCEQLTHFAVHSFCGKSRVSGIK